MPISRVGFAHVGFAHVGFLLRGRGVRWQSDADLAIRPLSSFRPRRIALLLVSAAKAAA